MKKLLAFVIVLAVMPSVASAKRYESVQGGRSVIVHTSRGPVAVHRLLPPYGLHKHVYAGEIGK